MKYTKTKVIGNMKTIIEVEAEGILDIVDLLGIEVDDKSSNVSRQPIAKPNHNLSEILPTPNKPPYI